MIKFQNDHGFMVGGEVVQLCEFLKDRLYFATLSTRNAPKSNPSSHFFCIDDEFVYVNYFNDFGPLHLGHIYRYCAKVRSKLNCPALGLLRIIHYTTTNAAKRANAAFLIASFAIIYLGMTPKTAYNILIAGNRLAFKPFQDASVGNSPYQLTLHECLEGLYRAIECGFVHFNDFCVEEFELYSRTDFGDMNWIVPQKLLAFCGPVSDPCSGHKQPEDYFEYFLINNITVVIRLSKRQYDAQSTFGSVGIKHYDLYYLDGSIPSTAILNKFLGICEEAVGGVAVHCKAGLGRTGSLIGAYIMKHYRVRAKEVIAWLRICRPGSVIGKQQAWLEDLEQDLWTAGDIFRSQRLGDGQIPYHKYGIYSILEKISRSSSNKSERRTQSRVCPNSRDKAGGYTCSRMRDQPQMSPRYVNTCGFADVASTSGSVPRRPPVPISMRQAASQPHRQKKMACVPGKGMLTTSAEQPRWREEETQGDKLRRAKLMRETNFQYKSNESHRNDYPI